MRDGASSTPGGIIRTLIELTAAARMHKPSDSLWVHFRTGRLDDCIALHQQDMIDNWVARHSIVDDAGQPLKQDGPRQCSSTFLRGIAHDRS
jgi:hypothetical protein